MIYQEPDLSGHGLGNSVRGRRVPGAPVLTLIALFAMASTAWADPVSAINRTRSERCVGRTAEPLQPSRDLQRAANSLSRGERLHDVLAALPSRPSFATSFHLGGMERDSDIARAAARFCADLANPSLREIGYAMRGQDLWVIATAPLEPPNRESRAQVEDEIFTAVNRARASGRRCGSRQFPPAAPLRYSEILSDVAQARSDAMAAGDRFEHVDGRGRTPADRVRGAGYAAHIVGENIAAGATTAREAVEGWLASAGHCSNIMDSRFTEMGVAYAFSSRSRAGTYWTQLLAEPR